MVIEKRRVPISKLNQSYTNGIVLGIGSEGCVHKFLFETNKLFERVGEDKSLLDLKYRIVSPRIPLKYMDQVLIAIRKMILTLDIDSIITNDYGLMYRLRKMENIETPIILGRTLIRSIEYVPWHDYILRDEEKNIRDAILLPNIIHTEKIILFKNYNVKGVELCATKNNAQSIKLLKKEGIASYIHYNSIIATVGRTCPTMRMEQRKIGDCQELCDHVLDVNLNRIWGINNLLYVEPTKESRKFIPPYKCIGNILYYDSNIDKSFPFAECDGLIFDYGFNTEINIESAIENSFKLI